MVRAGTAIKPIYLIIERASSYLNIVFLAEIYPNNINSVTGIKEFISIRKNNVSHIINLIILILNSFF